jgi:HAD-hyrolase-like
MSSPFRKSDPRHLLTALEQFRASPSESVKIGNNENDHAAARAAGVAVIVMRYGYLRLPPETLAPDAWLDQFADIRQRWSASIERDSANQLAGSTSIPPAGGSMDRTGDSGLSNGKAQKNSIFSERASAEVGR